MQSATTPQPVPLKLSVPRAKTKLRSCIDEKASFFFYKRFFDILISLLFIVFILSWLFPLLALLIWLDSGGPVLFVQERVGRGGKTFLCFKFRTMSLDYARDQARPLHFARAPRITALGNFLRKSNIDEFPQFINVLLGNMSIVGPRPHMHQDCSRFAGIVPRYKFRNFVKPGITGLAQIKGYHGPAIREESIIGRYEWDAYYIQNASFWLDIRIVHLTVVQSLANLLRLSRPERQVGKLADEVIS